jgi:hypothetical protein
MADNQSSGDRATARWAATARDAYVTKITNYVGDANGLLDLRIKAAEAQFLYAHAGAST